ncbi:hypothetical protein ScPMuIL_000539 [Solemya velum]
MMCRNKINCAWNCCKNIIKHTPSRPKCKTQAVGLSLWQSDGQTFCTAANEKSLLEKNEVGLNQETDQTNFQAIEDTLVQLQKDVNFKNDMPLEEMLNPYADEQEKCIICKYKIHLDYKNVQLLSQFVSPNTGQIYGRHITGLCIPMQKHVARLIKRSRCFGFMPFILKKPEFLDDPKLHDAFKPRR